MPDNQPQPTPTPTPAPAPTPPAAGENYVPASRFEAVVADKYQAIRRAEEAAARAADLERQLSEVSARLAQPAPQPNGQPNPALPGPNPAANLTAADLNRMAQERAQQIRFDERCNESVLEGRKVHADFDAAIDALRAVAPATDAQGRPMLPHSFVEAALETGRAHEVLYALGKDTSEADRIMSLPPLRQAVELARFADKVAPASGDGDAAALAAASEAAARTAGPVPIVPRVGAPKGVSGRELALDDPALPIDEWMRRREEEIKKTRESRIFAR